MFRKVILALGSVLIPGLLEAAKTVATATKALPTPPPQALPYSGLSPEITYALGTLGFGGIAGWCVGFTLKKFAKMAALILGIAFIAIQALAYNHFLSINWEQLQNLVPEPTLQNAWMSLMSMLTYNFPFAGAFFTGFYLGFRKG